MHWVLVYFLSQPVYPGAAGGVGQIRFQTESSCQSFYHALEKKFKPKSVYVNGVCMKWHK